MCCFSAKTRVSGTRIFARMTTSGVQALAYQMNYEAAAPTAMILPLPISLPAREDSVRFKNLKEYGGLFAALEAGFPRPEPRPQGRSRAVAVAEGAQPLVVHEVGDFIATFVPSVNDFNRVDARFVLSKQVWSAIPAYADYGFAVFQLKALSGAPHPIAFEFDTRMNSALFFPTVHIHDGTVHARGDFDHALYLQQAAFDARTSAKYEGPDTADRGTGFVRSVGPAKNFVDVGRTAGLVDSNLLVHRVTMRGSLPNKDMIYAFAADAPGGAPPPAAAGEGSGALPASGATPSSATPITNGGGGGCGRCDTSGARASLRAGVWGPGGAVLAALSWLIRRRDQRSQR